MSLTFNAETHRYRLDKRHVSGVTTILGKALPKPALPRWAAGEVAEYVASNPDEIDKLREMGGGKLKSVLKQVPWDKRDKAATRGTDIHAIAEELVWGREVEVPNDLADAADDFSRFLDAWSVEPIFTEQSVANRAVWYAGRPDFVGRVGGCFGGQVTLLDWKSGKGVYPEMALQLGAYARAEFYVADNDPDTEHPMPEVERIGLVHVTPEGVRVFDAGDPDQAFKLFRHAAYVAAKFPAYEDVLRVPAADPETVAVAS